MPEPTTCTRHPRTETRLRCSSCEDAICPRCAVDAPVGMRCPACATPDGGGGLRRRPEQIGRAAAVAAGGALLGGVALALFAAYIGFLSLLVSFFVGLQLGRRVRTAASGNTVDVVRGLAVAAGVGAGAVASGGLLLLGRGVGLYELAMVALAGFGAWRGLDG